MKERIMGFAVDESGQDLIEYALLLAFVCIASAAMFIGAGASMKNIWQVADTNLSQAASAVS